jgi:hypothetical protein
MENVPRTQYGHILVLACITSQHNQGTNDHMSQSKPVTKIEALNHASYLFIINGTGFIILTQKSRQRKLHVNNYHL